MRLRRILTATLCAGLILGTAPAAQAGGSDSPTPYRVTVEGIYLPEGTTFPVHGHVNWHTTWAQHGIHFDPNNGHPGAQYIGKNFLAWPHPLEPGECITWVQISMYNEHFGEGRQDPVCSPTDIPTEDPTEDPTWTETPEPTAEPTDQPTDPEVEPEPTTSAPPTDQTEPSTPPSSEPSVEPSPSDSPSDSATTSPTSPPLTNGGTDRLVPLTAPNPADAFDYPQDHRSWLARYPESVTPFEDILNTLQHRVRSGCTLTDQCDACNDGHWD